MRRFGLGAFWGGVFGLVAGGIVAAAVAVFFAVIVLVETPLDVGGALGALLFIGLIGGVVGAVLGIGVGVAVGAILGLTQLERYGPVVGALVLPSLFLWWMVGTVERPGTTAWLVLTSISIALAAVGYGAGVGFARAAPEFAGSQINAPETSVVPDWRDQEEGGGPTERKTNRDLGGGRPLEESQTPGNGPSS